MPARTIRALAREWASKKTVLSGGSRGGEGGACREAYGTEWARMMVLLQAMQGLGKPGVSIRGTTMGAPNNAAVWFPGYADADGRMCTSRVAEKCMELPKGQRLYRLILPESILNPPVSWRGKGAPAEMHHVCTSFGQGLERAPMRGGLSDRSPDLW